MDNVFGSGAGINLCNGIKYKIQKNIWVDGFMLFLEKSRNQNINLSSVI